MMKKLLFTFLIIFATLFTYGQQTITLTTTSTSGGWSPQQITNTGVDLTWEATNAVIGTVIPTSQIGSDPTFDFSSNDGTLINITATSTDNPIVSGTKKK